MIKKYKPYRLNKRENTYDILELYYGVMKKPYFLPDGWKKGDPVKVK